MQRNLAWVALALGSIWIAVAIISLSSPDLIYGADRDTFPLISAVTWMSGAAASSYVLRALVTRHPTPEDQRHAWVGIALSTTASTVAARLGRWSQSTSSMQSSEISARRKTSSS